MIRMKIPELLLVCIICVAVSKSTEDIKYALTFQATGCPNKNPAVTWWKTFSYDNTVFNDMFDRCALVRDGTETAYLKTECCGEGYDCKPTTCNKQSTWTTDPTTTPAPTTPNVAAVIVSYFLKPGDELCNATEIIDTLGECNVAISELDLVSFGEESTKNYPKGCYAYKDGSAYWNSHSTGSESRGSHRPICKKAMDVGESQGGSNEDQNSNVEDEEDEDDEDEEVDDDDDDDLYGTEREITRDFIPMREEEFRGRYLLSILSFLPVPKILVALGEMF